jgi:hypothetical protein
MACDDRPVQPHRRGSAVELRDAKTPDFFPVGRFERKHEVSLLCLRNLSLLKIIHL